MRDRKGEQIEEAEADDEDPCEVECVRGRTSPFPFSDARNCVVVNRLLAATAPASEEPLLLLLSGMRSGKMGAESCIKKREDSGDEEKEDVFIGTL
jgi:hypothetical protein